MSLLEDIPFIRRTRRNHAIEHAAVHILSARDPGLSMAGRSDSRGFWLYGSVDPVEVESAVREAMARLDAEPHLAIHPHCGTNLVVGGMVTGLTTLLAINHLRQGGRKEHALETLPRLMLAGTLAGVASKPLGPMAQKHVTTLPRAADARLVSVVRSERGKHVVHRVQIEDRDDGSRARSDVQDAPRGWAAGEHPDDAHRRDDRPDNGATTTGPGGTHRASAPANDKAEPVGYPDAER